MNESDLNSIMVELTASEKTILNNQAVENFREYLRIPSVQPDVDYGDCVEFLKKQAKSLDLPVKVYNISPKHPVVVLTWIGTQPNLPSILLNSHMDVVPVFEESWTHKPFSADIDSSNNIYARGTQDMKSVGIQYLEAIRRLKKQKITLKRTLHISFVPDEEIGGLLGMRDFVKTQQYRDLNVGFALDEGMANPTEEFVIFNGERSIWQLKFHCPGKPGHASLLYDNTAGEKVAYLINKFATMREAERKKLKDNPNLTIGDVFTINITQMRGGVQTNVIPQELSFAVDCRIPPENVDINKWEEQINQWCKEAGSGIRIEYEQKNPLIASTKLDNSNHYWVAFKKATDKLGLKLNKKIFPAATDSRYIRELGIPAIGFSPMNNTPVLLHDHDEYLGVDVFLKGIEIYSEILLSVANLSD